MLFTDHRAHQQGPLARRCVYSSLIVLNQLCYGLDTEHVDPIECALLLALLPALFDTTQDHQEGYQRRLQRRHHCRARRACRPVPFNFTRSDTRSQNLAAETAAYLTTKHPDYAILAARIAISNLHKETKKNFSQVIEDLYTYSAFGPR